MSSQWMGQHAPQATAAGGQIPVVTSILKDFSAEALGELRTWLEQNPPTIPVTQIVGFSQFTAQVATRIATNESTTSTSFTDLATVGPSLSGVPDGKYLVIFGCFIGCPSSSESGYMGVQINGSGASTSESAAVGSVTAAISVMTVLSKDLSSGGSNSITAKYRGFGGGSLQFSNRWLIALRYSNV